MRVVLDTNVLVAALTRPRGTAARILDAWRAGRFELIASEDTLGEVEAVVDSSWVARLASAATVERCLREIRERARLVQPRRLSDLPLKDPGDRRLVEAAVAGDADYLVTADRELLLYRGYGKTEFVTTAEFARLLESEAEASS